MRPGVSREDKQDLGAYFEYDSTLFADGKSQIVENNKMLRVTVKDSAPKDTLTYITHVFKDDTVVVGNSPPIFSSSTDAAVLIRKHSG